MKQKVKKFIKENEEMIDLYNKVRVERDSVVPSISSASGRSR